MPMPTVFDLISMVSILAITFVGGYAPLFRPGAEGREEDFPRGETFAAGVFLALSLTIMLPASFHLLGKQFTGVNYPLAGLLTIVVFLILLYMEQIVLKVQETSLDAETGLTSPAFPVILTVLIAIPSFFLGVALGISSLPGAAMILAAILAHKGTAGFALALKMTRSTMTRAQTLGLFCLFAFATPLGILVGDDLHSYLSGRPMMILKGAVLGLAAGAFLYMGTLHELRQTPLIRYCVSKKGFAMLMAGFVITALVRWLLGEAHRI